MSLLLFFLIVFCWVAILAETRFSIQPKRLSHLFFFSRLPTFIFPPHFSLCVCAQLVIAFNFLLFAHIAESRERGSKHSSANLGYSLNSGSDIYLYIYYNKCRSVAAKKRLTVVLKRREESWFFQKSFWRDCQHIVRKWQKKRHTSHATRKPSNTINRTKRLETQEDKYWYAYLRNIVSFSSFSPILNFFTTFTFTFTSTQVTDALILQCRWFHCLCFCRVPLAGSQHFQLWICLSHCFLATVCGSLHWSQPPLEPGKKALAIFVDKKKKWLLASHLHFQDSRRFDILGLKVPLINLCGHTKAHTLKIGEKEHHSILEIALDRASQSHSRLFQAGTSIHAQYKRAR